MPYKLFYEQLEQRVKELQREAADRNQVEEELHRSYQTQTVLNNMATLFLIYKDEHQLALNELMEEFSAKVQNFGILPKAAEFKDL